MIRLRTVLSFAALAALSVQGGCGKDDPSSKRGMPPADQIQPPPAMPSQLPGSARGVDPHAGLDMGGADPHAGLDMGGADPHAGLDMGGADPHAGVDMGGADMEGEFEDPAMQARAAMAGPPQPVDPNMVLEGTLTVTDKTAANVSAGDILFLSIKPINPVSGEVIGGTIAAERIDISNLPMPFVLTGANVMISGAKFEGEVLITARVDRDGEARTRNPGDIEGTLRAKIPTRDLNIVLDTVVN